LLRRILLFGKRTVADAGEIHCYELRQGSKNTLTHDNLL
jgi:hypothetical protein